MSEQALRIDRWLWFARFFKSRSLAAKMVEGRKLRLNRVVVTKSATGVRPGDVLTFPQGPHIRTVKIVALGSRRGPATEAQTLYEDLAPPAPKAASSDAMPEVPSRDAGAGRPTKAERRAIDRLQGRETT
ncbi:RNA-binding S4 domain-containing protein [Oceanibacterium hippocampi]|uniref:Heat shock protein 15 n=1 Tax=Oceanibacterium hippocampi TaxID=745714 RepID=A0A1Y5S6Q9_9PROT|nr:RNA-binding S4 domain-containing protein [Oceanibacterium hippocampi]SLN32477.1 Heat shock protein 15 [Oceanibacterium hippocampi]